MISLRTIPPQEVKENSHFETIVDPNCSLDRNVDHCISTSYHFTCMTYHLLVVVFNRFTAPEVLKLLQEKKNIELDFQLKHIIRLNGQIQFKQSVFMISHFI